VLSQSTSTVVSPTASANALKENLVTEQQDMLDFACRVDAVMLICLFLHHYHLINGITIILTHG
jgi:hypothetical protein